MNLFSPNQLSESLMPNGQFYNESADAPMSVPDKDPLEKFADKLSAVITGFSNFAIQYNFQVCLITVFSHIMYVSSFTYTWQSLLVSCR